MLGGRRRTVEIAVVTLIVAMIIYAAFAILEQREIAQHGL
jgi:ABC-type arginine transport system permease subunit